MRLTFLAKKLLASSTSLCYNTIASVLGAPLTQCACIVNGHVLSLWQTFGKLQRNCNVFLETL